MTDLWVAVAWLWLLRVGVGLGGVLMAIGLLLLRGVLAIVGGCLAVLRGVLLAIGGLLWIGLHASCTETLGQSYWVRSAWSFPVSLRIRIARFFYVLGMHDCHPHRWIVTGGCEDMPICAC